ncbi:MAG: hypothetical protein ACFFE5_15320, partial [Candidatus Thorarchaeota archaeon]
MEKLQRFQKIVGVSSFYFEELIFHMMTLNQTGFTLHKRNTSISLISSGDSTLDELLSGGFHRNLVYLLYGDKKLTTNILLTTAVIAQKASTNGGIGEGIRVAFIDGNNRFNPYNL